ncbi:MAG: AI-2E family transporter, partial [Bacillota bacterium]|nr:AI-2E family transporter [Bacillota bacterium]
MSRLKEFFSDKKSMRVCFYVVFTATLLCIMFFLIRDFGKIVSDVARFVGQILNALSPLILGLIIAYLLNPVVENIYDKFMSRVFLRKKIKDPVKREKKLKRRRAISVLITFLLVIIVIALIIYAFAVLIVGQLIFDSIGNMVEAVNNYFLQYEDTFRDLTDRLANSGLKDRYQEVINDVVTWISDHFSAEAIIAWLASLGGGLLNVALGAIVSVYLLADKENFLRLWRKLMHTFVPMKTAARINDGLHDINTALSLFIRGQLLDALIVAILASTGLTLIGMDFAVFIGCFAGIANIIPYFGPILGMIPAFIIGILTGGIWQALGAVAVLAVLQAIDGNIIYPKVVGTSTGLHPLLVLVAVVFGGHFWGILGMILAVPTATIIKLFIMRRLNAAEEAESQAYA